MNLSQSAFTLMICLISFNGIVRKAEPQNTIDPAVVMLNKFYKDYTTAWSTSTGDVLIKKLDSLQSKYCTVTYHKELKEEFKEVGLDHDELINDVATDVEHLNTLKIVKGSKKANEYIVSYLVFGKDVSNKPLTEKIIIKVLVVKDGRDYKIAAVKNGSYTVVSNK